IVCLPNEDKISLWACVIIYSSSELRDKTRIKLLCTFCSRIVCLPNEDKISQKGTTSNCIIIGRGGSTGDAI
ncbi:hypothetical protein MKW98_032528, partial [Papaver atlanticum]